MRNSTFYRQLRQRVTKYANKNGKNNVWIKYLLLAPDFFYLLWKLLSDKHVGPKAKFKIGLALAYFINPFDLIPDMLISVGFLDDIVAAAYAIRSVIQEVNPAILNKYWLPRRDVIDVTNDICQVSDKLIGVNTFKKISALFGE